MTLGWEGREIEAHRKGVIDMCFLREWEQEWLAMSGHFRLWECQVRALSSLDQECVTVEWALFQGPWTSGEMSCLGNNGRIRTNTVGSCHWGFSVCQDCCGFSHWLNHQRVWDFIQRLFAYSRSQYNLTCTACLVLQSGSPGWFCSTFTWQLSFTLTWASHGPLFSLALALSAEIQKREGAFLACWGVVNLLGSHVSSCPSWWTCAPVGYSTVPPSPGLLQVLSNCEIPTLDLSEVVFSSVCF